MTCPKCKTEELNNKGYDSPLYCNKCGGMWLAQNKLPNFWESVQEIPEENSTPNEHDSRTGLCPAGHGIMIRAKVNTDQPFYLEKCSTCGGIWFDQGEWQRIATLNFVEHLDDLWCRSWQRKQRKQQERNSFLKINQQLIGDELFQDIMKLAEKLQHHPDKGRAMALLYHESGLTQS